MSTLTFNAINDTNKLIEVGVSNLNPTSPNHILSHTIDWFYVS